MLFRYILFIILLSVLHIGYGQKIGIRDTIYITQCDTGSQGQMVLDLEAIKNSVFSTSQSIISPTIFIAVQGGSVIKIEHILTSPTIKNVCLSLGQNWTDIAINKDKEIYLCTNAAIYKLDTLTCTLTLFNQVNPVSSIYALSFDTKNNLYYSDGSIVYRFNNTTGTPVLWHDFGSGYASGDFVMKNGKMYISWVIGSSVRLYEVNVDNNINYVSHIDKCSLRLKTYGLASELGQLYGVTPSELYKIDDNLCQHSTILPNSGSGWYGAAGLHEAQNSITAHLNYSDAISISNQIKGNWINTIPFNQIIYLTIDDKIKDSIYLYPVKITIKPKAFITVNKTICKGNSYGGYSISGTYINSFKDKDGCDSTRTLYLTIVDKFIDTIRASICLGQTYRTYNSAGIYTENYKTVNGCDSIITIILKLNNPSFYTDNRTICTGKIYKGKTISGTYIFTYKNSLGCDSTVTLNLTVVTIPKPFINIYKCIIPGQNFKFYSQLISAPGIYIDSTNHIQDCDTIYRLTVSIVNPRRDTLKSTQCQGYNFKRNILINDTFILDTLHSYLGCDSIYVLYDFKIQKLYSNNPILTNYCDTFSFKTNIYHRDTSLYLNTPYGKPPYCDSLIQKYIFTKAPKPPVKIYTPMGTYCIKGESIVLESKGANRYLWNTTEISASIKIKPNETSIYTVKGWNEYNCLDSASIEIEVEDLVYFDIPKAFSPNGDGHNDIWTPNASGRFEIQSFEIYNRWGEKIFSGNQQNYTWNGFYKNTLQASGVYAFTIRFKKNRIIYERAGEVMLVR
jgi:gliding motility-associated-like protein